MPVLEPLPQLAESGSEKPDIWNEQDPQALINIAPKVIKEAMLEIKKTAPQLIGMPEHELRLRIRPTDCEDTLRLSFWAEYNRAQDAYTKMNLTNVWEPVCSGPTFYKIVAKPEMVAWICCPPQNYMRSMESYLNYGKENLSKLLKMDLFDHLGRLDTKRAQIFLKAYQLVENRVMGAVTQRIEQKTKALHVHEIAGAHNNEALVQEYEALKVKHDVLATIDVPPPSDGELEDPFAEVPPPEEKKYF